MILIDF